MMMRWTLLCGAIAHGSGGTWWWGNHTIVETQETSTWRSWVDRKVPWFGETLDNLDAKAAQANEWLHSSGFEGSEWSVWRMVDTMVGLFGWAIFGDAWDGVKVGFRRLLQLGAVLVACLAAHYAWAIAWPVVSFVIAIIMAMVWAVRLLVRVAGKLAIAFQRACGGAPEAYGAEFYGPGTGKVPETAELRRFKKHDADQWLVLKRGPKMVVFQCNGEPSSIKATGLFVAVDYDTVRGDKDLTRELKGVDRVHLCRNLTCPEEGHHFQTYGITKKVDAEKIQLAQATAGAAEACNGFLSWMWSTGSSAAAKVKDYASESETEEIRCMAQHVRWRDGQGVRVLSESACKHPGSERTQLLVEDQTEGEETSLCPSHANRYLLQRFCLKCCYQGCNHVGLSNDGGMQVCGTHKPQPRSRSTSKSRSREAQGGDPRGETVAEDVPENAEAIKSELKDVKRLLQEIQIAGKDVEGEDVENGPDDKGHRRRQRVTSRSPGRTPKSTIHNNLAKVGMLDSPGEPRWSLLEEFFDRFAEARPLGVGEDEIRNQLGTKYDMNPEAVAQKLCDQAVVEQAKGQKGLTKFIEKWREAVENARDSEGPASTWSVVGTQSFREAHIEKLDLWKLYFRAGSSKIELLKKSMF